MNTRKLWYKSVTYLIALVWLINGLYCKLLNLVPRHQLIVAEIIGYRYAGILTKTIGIAEIIMVVWITSSIKSRWCAITQIIVIIVMNLIEYFKVPHLLLFGKGNILLALLLITIIYCNEFLLHKKLALQPHI